MELPFLVTSLLVVGLFSPLTSGEKTITPALLMRNGFDIELECVIEEDCVFAATTPPDRFTSLASERWITNERFKKDPCEGQEKRSECCSAAVRDPDFLRGFNRRIRRKSEDVSKICKLLCTGERDANCYLSCDLSSWLFMCTKPTSTSPPTSTTDSDDDDDDDDNGDGSSTTVSSQSLQDDDETGPSVTIIVVSCLVAFLAGIVGAILITLFFFRRSRISKDSAETPQANTSAAYVAGDPTVYEELPEGTLYQKQSVKNRPNRISSENEYTYIPDHVTASRTASSSSYIVPVDHLAKRKLPTTPAQSDGKRENPGSRPANYSEAGNGGRNSKPYFELEKEASQAEETASPGDQYFILEKEGREATGTAPGNDDYYSPLKRDGEEDDGEYSALDRNKDCGVYTREYLELVPDYSLQKPVD